MEYSEVLTCDDLMQLKCWLSTMFKSFVWFAFQLRMRFVVSPIRYAYRKRGHIAEPKMFNRLCLSQCVTNPAYFVQFMNRVFTSMESIHLLEANIFYKMFVEHKIKWNSVVKEHIPKNFRQSHLLNAWIRAEIPSRSMFHCSVSMRAIAG